MALDLTTQSAKEFILERTQDAVQYDDTQAALEVLKIFREELPNQQEEIAGVPGLYDTYRRAWVTAQFIRLPSLADDDFFDLIKEHLVEGLRLPEYDIIDKIGLRISFMDLESEQITFMEQLLEVIKKNAGTLGSQNIKVAGRTALPTIQNWLADYDTYPSQSAQRSDYEQITYLSKSPAAAALSEEDKKVLLDILDCYDSLRNLLAYYRSLPDAPEDFFKPENLYQFYPGAEVVDSIEGEGVAVPGMPPASTAQPVAALIPPAPTPVVRAAAPVPRPPQPAPAPVAPKRPPLAPAAPAPASASAQRGYIVEEASPDPFKPKSDQKPVQTNAVAEEIKKNLRGMNLEPTRPPLNVQDFLNERHNKGNTRGGIVFGDSSQPAAPAAPSAPAAPAVPKAVMPPANLPTVKADEEEDLVAKKLAELRKRKQS
jgi:hypothetical protein